ncbi:MAG: hypothetical protein LAO55_02950 [Acidobacteriia bacterium]|nr:hypothetical protein [Terriglobia bacterium]
MDSRQDKRYLHIAGAFGVGGRLTKIGNVPINLPIETVAAAHLPMVGGRSEAAGKLSIDGGDVKFGRIDAKLIKTLKKMDLLSVGSARSLAESDAAGPDGPFVSRTISEVSNVAVADGFSLRSCVLNMTSTQAAGEMFPSITLGKKTSIVGLKLGKLSAKVTLDLDTFNRFPTQAAFLAECQKNGNLRQSPFSSFLTDAPAASLHRNASGYVIGSLVKKIEGLPDGMIEDNGYIINWPPFGKIIVGEILIGPYVRRVTLVRLKHSDTEIGSGCSGGSTWP